MEYNPTEQGKLLKQMVEACTPLEKVIIKEAAGDKIVALWLDGESTKESKPHFDITFVWYLVNDHTAEASATIFQSEIEAKGMNRLIEVAIMSTFAYIEKTIELVAQNHQQQSFATEGHQKPQVDSESIKIK
jgi:glutaminase